MVLAIKSQTALLGTIPQKSQSQCFESEAVRTLCVGARRRGCEDGERHRGRKVKEDERPPKTSVLVFFCTGRGAMCAEDAQVTLG